MPDKIPGTVKTHFWTRRHGSSREALHVALLRDAAEHVAGLPGVRRFTVNAVVNDAHRLRIARGPFALDAITQIAFDAGAEAARHAEQHPGYRRWQDALRPVANAVESLDIVQRVYVAPPDPEGGQRDRLLKRMSVLCRAPHLSAEQFQQTWQDDHGPRVAQNPRLLGYIQNAVAGSGEATAPAPACDGITELWFENLEAMEAVLPEQTASAVTGNAARIIGNISTFLVREVRIF